MKVGFIGLGSLGRDAAEVLNEKHDVVGLRIYDQRENNLPNIGLIHMQDNESDKMIFFDTSNKKIRMDFASNRSKKIKAIQKLFPTSGADLIDIDTGNDYVKPLITFFKNRGKRR